MNRKKDYNKRFKENSNTRYAKGKDGSLIEAKKGMNIDQPFTCGGCGEEVRAYAVNTEGLRAQTTHFRHIRNSNNSGCGDSESYIHWISKELFAAAYAEAKSFIFKYRRFNPCKQAKDDRCGEEILHPVDLKLIFPYIKVERRDGSYIPDCMIYNDKGDKVYIEIKYTSTVSQEKIKSGLRIVEIKVENENQMLKIIENNTITEENNAIKLYNFDRKRIKVGTFDCQEQCVNEIRTFTYELKSKPVQRIYNAPKPQERPKIIGTQIVQLFRPKICFRCDNHPIHYMNVGRIFVDDDFNVAGIEDELFKDEITSSNEFSIAIRVDKGDTNSYYCPVCRNWIANNRLLKGTKAINIDDRIIKS